MPTLRVVDLDTMAYGPALDLQLAYLRQVRDEDPPPETLLLVEHDPPVVTLGTSGRQENLLAAPEALAEAGIETHVIRRGGDVTYHGPGQLVAYPIMRVDRRGRDVHSFLRDLEEVVIRTLGRLDVPAHRVKGLTGVWTPLQSAPGGEGKIAAIGVGVKRWVSYHGLALNVCPNMEHFGLIVPCGIADKPVTSLAEVLGREISVSRVKPALIESTVEVFGFSGAVSEAPPDLDAAP